MPDYILGNAEAIPACSQHGTGGPVGLPIAVDGKVTKLYPQIDIPANEPPLTDYYNAARTHYENKKMSNFTVHVAVLDTLPNNGKTEAEVWQKLCTQINDNGKKWSSNPFYQDFFNLDANHCPTPNGDYGLVKIIPNSYITDNSNGWDDNCCFAYHGIAVASIIYQIAEKSRISLYQTLNSYGVTSLSQIAKAMRKLKEDVQSGAFGEGPLIVNCSFVVGMGLNIDEDGCLIGFDWDGNLRFLENLFHGWYNDVEDALENHSASPDESPLQLRRLFMVAASGNDNNFNHLPQNKCNSKVIPPPRMPALASGFVGVAALPQNETKSLTNYSNLDDRPTYQGLAAFGGELDNQSNPTKKGHYASKKGIVGIFLQDAFSQVANDSDGICTDSGDQNANGFGHLAGTSFAAPVISGFLSLLSSVQDSMEDETKFPKPDEIIFSGSHMRVPGLQCVPTVQTLKKRKPVKS